VSRAIQVRVSESVVRTVHVEDGVQSPLEMLPVLARDRMAELLAAELEKLGFLREGNKAARKDADGIEVTVDLAAATITVKLGADAKLSEEVELSARVGVENQQTTESNLREDAQRELETRVAERTEALRRQVTKQLENKLGDLRKELDGAVGRATVAALTERAAQLGSIQEVSGDEAGNVTIRVKL
jgi:TATA-binding protein-associated factor Taf7